ncbi:MAG: hypothetical protein HYR71_12355 [Chloroflexi bacterium]|nr:hypothetical protein [Chloroflexota bacterium]
MSHYIERPLLAIEYFNDSAILPYDLSVAEIKAAIHATYDFFHGVNVFLVEKGYGQLEELLLGNSFAGVLSEILVTHVARYSQTLTRNRQVGGYPDLIPRGGYANDAVHRGTTGIEVKSSKQSGGWQGHNAEQGWLMIFRYTIDSQTQPIADREPTQIVEVLGAELTTADWSFSGRSGASRRTITASVNRRGMEKLRANAIYRHPDFGAAARRKQ